MSQSTLAHLADLGQSVWLDYIHRTTLESGELDRLIAEDGVRGVTSNPTIFDKAIADGGVYDAPIAAAVADVPDIHPEALFFRIAIEDIRDAADRLAGIHSASDGHDGLVSLEVSPELADDTEATIEQALELHERVARDNLMVKVPATRAGLPAIEALTARGVNVNVTLLFSVERYREVAEHWIRGLERRLEAGQSIDRIASVASFFVSRVDTAVDPRLASLAPDLREAITGRIAIANAARAYGHFLDTFDGERFAALARAGARPQRLLWASTGTKNPDYSDVLYVERLIADRTVNTMPPATLDAFRDHGRARTALAPGRLDGVMRPLDRLPEAGIDLDRVTERLEREGVEAFVASYRHLLETLAERAGRITATRG